MEFYKTIHKIEFAYEFAINSNKKKYKNIKITSFMAQNDLLNYESVLRRSMYTNPVNYNYTRFDENSADVAGNKFIGVKKDNMVPDDMRCSICLEDGEGVEDPVFLPCCQNKQVVCRGCLKSVLHNMGPNCPTCRKNMLEELDIFLNLSENERIGLLPKVEYINKNIVKTKCGGGKRIDDIQNYLINLGYTIDNLKNRKCIRIRKRNTETPYLDIPFDIISCSENTLTELKRIFEIYKSFADCKVLENENKILMKLHNIINSVVSQKIKINQKIVTDSVLNKFNKIIMSHINIDKLKNIAEN